MLACWRESLPADAWAVSLRAISCLFQYGNPTDGYWANLSVAAHQIIKGRVHAEQRMLFRLMAQIAYYSDNGSAQEREGLNLFETCAGRALVISEGAIAVREEVLYEFCRALSILEDKTMSYRNRRIKANPGHPLLRAVEIRLLDVLEKGGGVCPSRPCIVS